MKKKRTLKPVAMLLVIIMIFSLAPELFVNVAKYFRTTQISANTINTDAFSNLATGNDNMAGDLAVPDLEPELPEFNDVILGAAITEFGSASFPRLYPFYGM